MSNLLVKPVCEVINEVIDRVAPDATVAEKIKGAITEALINSDDKALKAQADIIMAEANGDSSLQRNWRPMVMIWFSILVGAHWLGFTPENLSESQVLGLLAIVKVGLGGYVVGRSAEKVMKEYKK